MSEVKPQFSLPKFKFNVRTLVFLGLAVLIFLFISGTISPIGLFDLVLLEPMLNFLIILTKYLGGSFGLAIIALTIIIRLVTLPLTMRQLRSTRAMQELQPKMKELQKKYAKDKQKLQQEMFKLYKEEKINPLGCAVPMLIQFPVWIGLYQAIIQGLGASPENLVGLSKHLYPWSIVQDQVPLSSHFLGLDLGSGNIIMAILVAASMWFLQKMSTQPSMDPAQQQTSRMMVWMMPLMFGFFALTFPSGLSLYWILSNIISIVLQYRVTGWGTLSVPEPLKKLFRQGAPAPAGNPAGAARGAHTAELQNPSVSVEGEEESHRRKVRDGKHRNKRKVRRRSR
ncbi:MAG: membrane protein insertase YidC [Dehalococcoidia bacterium]|nr:membrane protein insertase YidC [Dehalococcoidia bacterium]